MTDESEIEIKNHSLSSSRPWFTAKINGESIKCGQEPYSYVFSAKDELGALLHVVRYLSTQVPTEEKQHANQNLHSTQE